MRDGWGALVIKGQDSSPSCPSELLVSTLISFSMNFTFKVARPGAQFNIVAYTGPPPPKHKRLPAPPQREGVMEEYSLPDLAPNSVFDKIDAGTSQERAAELGPSAFVDDMCKASVSLVQDAEAMDTNLAGKRESVALLSLKHQSLMFGLTSLLLQLQKDLPVGAAESLLRTKLSKFSRRAEYRCQHMPRRLGSCRGRHQFGIFTPAKSNSVHLQTTGCSPL